MSREYFIKRDFGLYDSGLLTLISPSTFLVYEVLRRFVWRGKDTRSTALRALRKQGLLAARVNQTHLAEYTGLRRESVSRCMQQLYKLAWVSKLEDTAGTACSYVLGELISDGHGLRHEVFYADAWLEQVLDDLDTLARAQLGIDARLTELPFLERVAFVKGVLENTSPQNPTPDAHQEHTGETPPTNPPQHPPSSPTPSPDPVGEELHEDDNGVTETTRAVPVHNPSAHAPSPRPNGGPKVGYQFRLPSAEERSAGRGEDESTTSPSRWGQLGGKRGAKRPALHSVQGDTEHGEGCDVEITGGVMRKSQGVCDGSHTVRREKRMKRNGEEKSVGALQLEALNTGGAASSDLGTGPQTEETDHPAGDDTCVVWQEDQNVGCPTVEDLRRVEEAAVARARAEGRRRFGTRLDEDQGKRRKSENLSGKPVSLPDRAQLRRFEEIWCVGMRRAFPDLEIAKWGPAERGKARNLLQKYSGPVVEQALDYLISEWPSINERILKGRGSVPSLGLLLKVHDILVPEAQRWAGNADVLREYEQWFKDHPNDPYPPDELERRYRAAQEARSSGALK
jgi:hypothetical protein